MRHFKCFLPQCRKKFCAIAKTPCFKGEIASKKIRIRARIAARRGRIAALSGRIADPGARIACPDSRIARGESRAPIRESLAANRRSWRESPLGESLAAGCESPVPGRESLIAAGIPPAGPSERLAPARKGGRIDRQVVPHELLSAEELEVGVLKPLRQDRDVRELVGVLQKQKPGGETGPGRRSAGVGRKVVGVVALESLPVDQARKLDDRMDHVEVLTSGTERASRGTAIFAINSMCWAKVALDRHRAGRPDPHEKRRPLDMENRQCAKALESCSRSTIQLSAHKTFSQPENRPPPSGLGEFGQC